MQYINENMHNVVLSIDGRKKLMIKCVYEVVQGYDDILPNYKKLQRCENRIITIRGTFTSEILTYRGCFALGR